MNEKYKTCKHSMGNVGELIVYVHPSCPRLWKINGTLATSKIRCKECKSWEDKSNDKS